MYSVKMFREANRCADALAKLGANMEDDFVVFASPPSVIASLLFSNKLGVTQDCIYNSMVGTT